MTTVQHTLAFVLPSLSVTTRAVRQRVFSTTASIMNAAVADVVSSTLPLPLPPTPPPLNDNDVSSTNNNYFELDNVLSNQDLLAGVAIALALVSWNLFLQQRRDQEIISSKAGTASDVGSNATTTTTTTTTYLYEDWNDISNPDNYIWYKQRIKAKDNTFKTGTTTTKTKTTTTKTKPTEQRWVLVALLLLFAPIFSFEFFLTLSRQLFCEVMESDLCTPYS